MVETIVGPPEVEDPARTPPPPPPEHPRLVRSRDDRVVAGVAAGLAAHLGIDPALVRIGFIILAFAGGWGAVAYLVAWLVIPEAPLAGGSHPPQGAVTAAGGTSVVLGALLVLLGAAWLIDQLLPGIGHLTWPVALMLLGVGVVLTGGRR